MSQATTSFASLSNVSSAGSLVVNISFCIFVKYFHGIKRDTVLGGGLNIHTESLKKSLNVVKKSVSSVRKRLMNPSSLTYFACDLALIKRKRNLKKIYRIWFPDGVLYCLL